MYEALRWTQSILKTLARDSLYPLKIIILLFYQNILLIILLHWVHTQSKTINFDIKLHYFSNCSGKCEMEHYEMEHS